MLFIQWTDDSGQAQTMDVDATPSEAHESPAEVTEHAVERGASITDHVRPGTDTTTLECMITNTPFETRSWGTDGATISEPQALYDASGKNTGAMVRQPSGPFDRVTKADQQFVALRDAGALLIVTTNLRVLEDVVIQSYRTSRDALTGRVLSFTLELRKLRIVETQAARVTAPVQPRGQGQQNRGNAPAAAPDPPPNESLLQHIRDAL